MQPGDLELRASDAERHAVVEALGAHFLDGRLTMEEHSDRLALAMSARTRGDLAALTADLPAAAPSVPPPTGRRLSWEAVGKRFGPFLVPSGICTVVWAFTGHGYFWPEWVMLGTGISVLRGRRGGARRHDHRGHDHRGHDHHGADLPEELDAALASQLDPPGPEQRHGHAHPGRHDDRGPALGAPVGQTGGRPGRAPATLAFVDVVGSTAHARRLGDRRWAELLGSLAAGADRALATEGGELVFHRGDEVVGAFPGPSAAVRWALAVREHASRLGLQVRAGLHAGEVERANGQLTGVALHLGQRASTVAEPDEVLVTSTVADLLAGSDVRLVDRGTHQLKGFDEPWRLFAVV